MLVAALGFVTVRLKRWLGGRVGCGARPGEVEVPLVIYAGSSD